MVKVLITGGACVRWVTEHRRAWDSEKQHLPSPSTCPPAVRGKVGRATAVAIAAAGHEVVGTDLGGPINFDSCVRLLRVCSRGAIRLHLGRMSDSGGPRRFRRRGRRPEFTFDPTTQAQAWRVQVRRREPRRCGRGLRLGASRWCPGSQTTRPLEASRLKRTTSEVPSFHAEELSPCPRVPVNSRAGVVYEARRDCSRRRHPRAVPPPQPRRLPKQHHGDIQRARGGGALRRQASRQHLERDGARYVGVTRRQPFWRRLSAEAARSPTTWASAALPPHPTPPHPTPDITRLLLP